MTFQKCTTVIGHYNNRTASLKTNERFFLSFEMCVNKALSETMNFFEFFFVDKMEKRCYIFSAFAAKDTMQQTTQNKQNGGKV
jgi:hypothetical protein